MKQTTFSALPIGAEFSWGAYKKENMNWGRKRSSRTADWRPRILGNLSDYTDWGYFKGSEVVYVD
jgi:hypothetical protein